MEPQMKIVDRKTFLDMPPGTVFAKFGPLPSYVFGDVMIKGETSSNDFWMQPFISIDADDTSDWAEEIEQSITTGHSIGLDLDYEVRDGLFENDQLFAVWEHADVKGLIA